MTSADEGYFRTRCRPDERRDRVWKVLCRHLRRDLPPQAKVLDLGAGYCAFINHMWRPGAAQVYCVAEWHGPR